VTAGVVWIRQSDPSPTLVPGTPPEVTPAPTPAPTVAIPPPTTPTTTSSPTDNALSVSYLDPPPLLEPFAFATIEGTFSGGVAVSENGPVALDPATQQVAAVAWNGAYRVLPVRAPLDEIVAAGPEGVMYGVGWAPNGAVSMYAVALADGGQIVAESVVDRTTTAFPIATFGHGPSGIVDRRSGEQIMGYVHGDGQPLDLDWDPPPLFTIDENDTVRTADGTSTWRLHIERHPQAPTPLEGASPPAPTEYGGAVYWTSIGPPEDPEQDPANATIPVIAVLDPDGRGQWYRLPDGWSVAASDVWGTILTRRVGEQLELATLTPPGEAPPPPTTTSVPPVDASPLATLAQAIGASTVIAREPGKVTAFTGGATTEVATPPGVYVQTDGRFLWWNTTGATLDGTIVCEVDGTIYRMRREADGGYVASWEDGDPDQGSALPNYEVDCESGETREIPPRTWFEETGSRHIEHIDDRTFTFRSDAEGNGDVTNEDGISINGEDYAGYHTFNADGSRVVYGDMNALASPHVTNVLRARDTTTGELLWSAELPQPVTVTYWYGDRIAALAPTAGVPGVDYEAVIVVDARTGHVIETLPTTMDLAFVG
jgi:hypothetical protein